MFKQRIETVFKVRDSEDTLQLYFRGVFQTLFQAPASVFHQLFVSVLTAFAIFKNPTPFSPETPQKLITQDYAFRISVRGNENRVFVIKILLDEVIKVIEVGVSPVGYADNVVEAYLVE